MSEIYIEYTKSQGSKSKLTQEKYEETRRDALTFLNQVISEIQTNLATYGIDSTVEENEDGGWAEVKKIITFGKIAALRFNKICINVLVIINSFGNNRALDIISCNGQQKIDSVSCNDSNYKIGLARIVGIAPVGKQWHIILEKINAINRLLDDI